MEKTKFNLETLIKMPVGDPRFFLYSDGCGCAFGVGYVASHTDIDWTPTKFDWMDSPKPLAADCVAVVHWKSSLDKNDPVLFKIFRSAEFEMLVSSVVSDPPNLERLVPPDLVVKIKKELIEALAENGYVDVPEDADIGVLCGA